MKLTIWSLLQEKLQSLQGTFETSAVEDLITKQLVRVNYNECLTRKCLSSSLGCVKGCFTHTRDNSGVVIMSFAIFVVKLHDCIAQ